MAKGGFKVLDSDMHIIEPPDLWEKYVEPEFRGLVPHGTEEFKGDLRLTHEGRPWGRTTSATSQTRRRGRNYEKNQERWAPYEAQGWSGQAQLQGMDVEGIDAAVLYPSRGLFALTVNDMDPKLAAAVGRAYNNWMYDFIQADPARLFASAMISPFNVDDAARTGRT